MQLPGFGIIVAMTVLAAIGDITRFPCAKKLIGYAGLGASVHASGETHRTGHITKQGRKDLRWILVEAARIAVLYHDYWKQEYARLEKRLGSNKAIVVIARQHLGDEKRGGLTSRQFIRLQLMRLKMGDDLTHVRHGINARPLATVDEVLALHPELKSDA